MDNIFSTRIIDKSDAAIDDVVTLLLNCGLELEQDLEITVCIYCGERLVATGSAAGKVLKCIAVDQEYREYGLSATVLTELIQERFARGVRKLFIYTKLSNVSTFCSMGFFMIAQAEGKVALLENKRDGIKVFAKNLERMCRKGSAGAIVMNANPFTLGHQWLCEQASNQVDNLYVFVVEENVSEFNSVTRLELVRKGTAHIKNITVLSGGDYIISSATFSTYFLKQKSDAAQLQAELDMMLFATYIAPALGITKRFAGSEPYCDLTRMYNDVMASILPAHGIEQVLFERRQAGGEAISATQVRVLAGQGDYEALDNLVPKTTLEYLRTNREG